MLNPQDYRQIVSGRRTDLRARLWRSLFSAIETPYAWAVRSRNRRYDRPGASIAVEIPVISVGNLTLGGTGKTPVVELLARYFLERGVKVTLVSRGYKSTGGVNDEAMELASRLPGVPHIQQPDRVVAARLAIGQGAQLILLDDGFQHRRLHRDLDIVLVDALEPFGYGRVFPRGMLREPLCGFARADVIALSRADAVTPERREEIRREVMRHQPDAVWVELTHRPRAALASTGEEHPLESLRGVPLAAFCGIGNPDGFRHVLASCEYSIRDMREYPDHHRYVESDIRQLEAWASALSAKALVCTHKDIVKISPVWLTPLPAYALQIRADVLSGQASLEALLAPLAERASALAVG